MTTRSAFRKRLYALTEETSAMCTLAGSVMAQATTALLRYDEFDSAAMQDDLTELHMKHRNVERSVLVTLACEAPVARDLRYVVSALHIASDADRMGELAAHVARTVHRRRPAPVVTESVAGYFEAMGRLVVDLADAAAAVVVDGDIDRADRIRQTDDSVDELHRRLFAVLMSRDWDGGVQQAVDLILLGRFYERFGDHATAIADWIEFRTTGNSPLRGDTAC